MNFEVTKYDDTLNVFIVYVWCKNYDRETTIAVIKNDYHFWLLRNNKLKWIITKSEGIVHRIEEVEGMMSFKEYWEQETSYILSDLKEFISQQTSNYFQKHFNKLKLPSNEPSKAQS